MRPCYYLVHQQMLNLMQTELIYPSVKNHFSQKQCEKIGKQNPIEAVWKHVAKILSYAPEKYFSVKLVLDFCSLCRILLDERKIALIAAVPAFSFYS